MSLASLRHLLLPLLLLAAVSPAFAAGDEELGALGFIPETAESLVTTSRIPRPASKIAENVTVITAEEIARLNAHTLADVLNTIPGIQIDPVRTPGSPTFFSIQGIYGHHIMVQMDGVPLNSFSDNWADIGAIPVQIIDRVEIVKGAASAAWGQALGGVVNIVTKSPDPERAVGGAVSASLGERSTNHLSGELTGTVGRAGYYLSGGKLKSDGLAPGNQADNGDLYAKLTYSLPRGGLLTAGINYRSGDRGLEERADYDWRDTLEHTYRYSFINLSQPLGERFTLELNARESSREQVLHLGALSTPDTFDIHSKDTLRGASARLLWGDRDLNLVAGVEYDHQDFDISNVMPSVDYYDRLTATGDRLGLYANGAITFGRLTLLPGIRYDHTGFADNYTSYTLGTTYQLSDSTVLRAYGARGYSIPRAMTDHGLQKIWTAQVGVESSAIPCLWLKGSLFYNDISNLDKWSVTDDHFPTVIKQGFEVEFKTTPLYGFALGGGYTFTHSRDEESGERLSDTPSEQAKLNLYYDNAAHGLGGVLTGNYVWYRSSSYYDGTYTSLLWDLHLNWKMARESRYQPELFGSVHNLFNGSQYSNKTYPNPSRWLELGLRFKF